MASVSITTQSGGEAGTADLDAEIFGIEPNTAVMHQVVTAQLAARRAGTHSTLTRREVRGGGGSAALIIDDGQSVACLGEA